MLVGGNLGGIKAKGVSKEMDLSIKIKAKLQKLRHGIRMFCENILHNFQVKVDCRAHFTSAAFRSSVGFLIVVN